MAREQKRVHQGEAASVIGVSQSTISRIETGAHRLDHFELIELCRLYGVDLAEIVQPPTPAEEEEWNRTHPKLPDEAEYRR